MQITKENLPAYWEDAYILHSLIIAHSVYWRGSRVGANNEEDLSKFLVQHSLAKSRADLKGNLKIYSGYGLLNSIDKFSPKTGFVAPDAYELIQNKVGEEYKLEMLISPGYKVADFLWDIYQNRPGTESLFLTTFEVLFSNSLGFQVKPYQSGNGHTYLRLQWREESKDMSWWIGFLPGGFSKRDDRVAEGLITSAAWDMHNLHNSFENNIPEFLSICGLEFSDTALLNNAHINDSNAINSFLIQLYSLLKLVSWGDKKGLGHFSHFFDNQSPDRPLSTKLGIRNINDAIKSTGK